MKKDGIYKELDLRDFILRTTLENTDKNGQFGNPEFDTHDFIFLLSREDILELEKGQKSALLTSRPSDYAIMTGVRLDCLGFDKKVNTYNYLRTTSKQSSNMVNRIDVSFFDSMSSKSILDQYVSSNEDIGLRPAMKLDLEKIISARKVDENSFPINEVLDEKGEVKYHTIEFGRYPQDYASKSDAARLFYSQYIDTGVNLTDKTFVQFFGECKNLNHVYEFCNQEYARVALASPSSFFGGQYKDGSPLRSKEEFAEIQPIKWIILNWNNMPQEINPYGDGSSRNIFVLAEETLLSGISFYQNKQHLNGNLWQNSEIRAFLNDYDLEQELLNGNGKFDFASPLRFDYSKVGFMSEAFEGCVLVQEQNDFEQLSVGSFEGESTEEKTLKQTNSEGDFDINTTFEYKGENEICFMGDGTIDPRYEALMHINALMNKIMEEQQNYQIDDLEQ